jgi:hypothetical protein
MYVYERIKWLGADCKCAHANLAYIYIYTMHIK